MFSEYCEMSSLLTSKSNRNKIINCLKCVIFNTLCLVILILHRKYSGKVLILFVNRTVLSNRYETITIYFSFNK